MVVTRSLPQRIVAAATVVVVALSSANAAVAGDEDVVRSFLETHCTACHGPDEQQAQIRLDQLGDYRIEDEALWTAVHEKLLDREMPPPEASQPSPEERRSVLAWIEKAAVDVRDADERGRTRRLNRRELGAALRDLTGLDVDYTAALPGDGTVNGFDTGAAGLQDAADSVARTMEVTRRAVDGIRFLEPPRGVTFAADLLEVKDARKALDPWKAQDATVKTRGVGRPGVGLLLEPKWLGERGGQSIALPAPANGRGVVRMRLVVSAVRPYEDVPWPHLRVDVGGTAIDYREITGTVDEPDELVYEIQLDDLAIGARGIEIELSNRVEIPYAIDGFENDDRTKPEDEIPGGSGLFRPKFDRKKTPPEEQPVPYLALQSIEIEPDFVKPWPPEDWDVGDLEIVDDDSTVRRLLSVWMERAWRRPVRASEQERFLALHAELRGRGLPFDEAMRTTFQAVLMSGPFRYLASPADPDETVAQHAIASRLGFLLWGTPPDAELRRLAAEGRLRDPDVLDTQVDRMLADERSDAFFRPFVTQWLEMEQPITIAMTHLQKQGFRFGRYLKWSMREETIAYVRRLFADNEPATRLVDGDWTMMNDSLAIHYGYDGIEGGRLRKVRLRDDDPRGGGLLGHAGIQSMLCWMGENWVVYRGAWTLRHVLDDPPPPPPLEVPELIPSDRDNGGKSFRELLRQHQEDEKCAVCHRTMDPLGFAFQNFDLSGRWRDVEYEKYVRNELDGKIEWRGTGDTRPVDAAGRLPRGEEFHDFDEFKRTVVANYLPDLVRGLLKNLVVYGTGHRPDANDMNEIRGIVEATSRSGHPLRDVLKSFVQSRVFLESSVRRR